MKTYKARLITEYEQLCNRYKRLITQINFVDCDELQFTLSSPLELLKEQADVMKRYIDILLRRDEYEKIGLKEYEF